MGKMEKLDIWEAKFLLILIDGRSKDVWEIAQIMRGRLDPTTHLFVQKIAWRLSERGLIKSTWGGYKITDAGLALLRTGWKVL